MVKISVVINTLNEEKNIPRALASVASLADEIVVVDIHSDDKTGDLARSLGAKVFAHKRTGFVEPARNFAVSKAEGEWILVLDADEEVQQPLANKLKLISVDSNSADYYRIPRKNVIFNKWIKHSRWWPDYNIRFFRKGFVRWSEIIHSVPETKGVGADLEEKEDLAIVHHHYESIEKYLDRMNRYTSIISRNMVNEGYKFVWLDLIKKPVNEFLSRFFQGEGYKDGLHGIALAELQSFSEFVTYLKVWQYEKFKEKNLNLKDVVKVMKEKESDIHYWQADSLLKEFGGLIYRIKRRFKL